MFNWFKTRIEKRRIKRLMKEPWKFIVTDKKILSKSCKEVKSEEVENIVRELEKTLLHVKGYGLSANQIGINKRVSIIRLKDYSLNLINPIIKGGVNKFVYKQEGCLSFPGIRIDTDRFRNILLENHYKEEKIFPVRQFPAIVIQHEVAHLNGKTIFDFKHKNIKKKNKGTFGKPAILRKDYFVNKNKKQENKNDKNN